jgi:hypothetical protein
VHVCDHLWNNIGRRSLVDQLVQVSFSDLSQAAVVAVVELETSVGGVSIDRCAFGSGGALSAHVDVILFDCHQVVNRSAGCARIARLTICADEFRETARLSA